MRIHIRRRSILGLALASALITACATDDVTGIDDGAQAGSFTADAATQWRFVSFADSATVAPTPSANESAAWDIAFFSTNVTLNGGAAGPGGVTAACICQNAAATNEEILAMTPESELADFEAVTSIPAGTTFVSDQLTPAITAWFTGSGVAAAADTNKAWQVRLNDSTAYAVVRVLSLIGASANNAGQVSLEFKVQATAAGALGATDTLVVDLTTAGAKSIDLNTGALTTSTTDWDLRLEGFTIRVNGGVSGPGKAAAALSASQYAATTTGVTAANAYKLDVYAGIFGTNRWYKYNLAGDNRISPTFDVYLVRRGSTTYKVQLINYYGPTGTPRQISFRWARLD